MKAQFDRHARSYSEEVDASVSFTGKDVDFFAHRKAVDLLEIARRHVGDPAELTMLDVGCGTGVTARHLVDHVGQLHGVDLSGDAIATATDAVVGAQFEAYDGGRLPFEEAAFDLVFAICVFHHVEVLERKAFAAELGRVVRPGGVVVVWEHNPYNPMTRVAVDRCPFDEGVTLLPRRETERLLGGAGLTIAERRYATFLPIDRDWAQRAERHLGGVPFGAQHYVVARRQLPSG